MTNPRTHPAIRRPGTCLLTVLAAAGVAFAQTTERQGRILEIGSPLEDQLLWTGSGELPSVIRADGSARSQELSTVIPLAGGAILERHGDDLLVLLCGRDPAADEGVVEIYVWDHATSSFIHPPTGAIHREPHSDFVGVATSAPSLLYLLDARQQRILFAPRPSTGELPSSFRTLATKSQLPALRNAARLTLFAREVDNSLHLILAEHTDPGADRHTLTLSPNGSSIAQEIGIRNRSAGIDSRDMVIGADWVRVTGPAGVEISVVCEDTASRPAAPRGAWVMGSAITDADGTAVIRLSARLQPRGIYRAIPGKSSDPRSPCTSPVHRDGCAELLGPASAIRPLATGLALTTYLGNRHFRIPVWTDPIEPAAIRAPTAYRAWLSVGGPDDIVTTSTGRSVLLSPHFATAKVRIWEPETPGFGVVKMPIPNDPALAEGTVHCQWIVEADGNLHLSDILGLPVREARWSPNDATENSADDHRGDGAPDFDTALARWLRSVDFEQRSAQDRTELLRHLSR